MVCNPTFRFNLLLFKTSLKHKYNKKQLKIYYFNILVIAVAATCIKNISLKIRLYFFS